MYETLLVPTDGSEHARRAAEHALGLAGPLGAAVHAVNVVDVQAAAGPFDAGGVDEEYTASLEAAGEAVLDDFLAAVDGEDVERAVRRGEPGDAILEYAAEAGADLVAMGTHGRTGIERYAAGSVTERVLRHAEVPVLTVRATDRSEFGDGYDDVLVPTDGSDAAFAAVEHAIAVADLFDATVHAVTVVNINELAPGVDYTPPTEALERHREAGRGATENVAETVRDAGLEVVTAVREGLPARDLLGYADESGIDLVAMGTAGRTGLNRYLLGSTTQRLVRHAEVPVLGVPAGDPGE